MNHHQPSNHHQITITTADHHTITALYVKGRVVMVDGCSTRSHDDFPRFDFSVLVMKVEKTPCPNCERPTPVKELNLFHGVCKFCRASFHAAHSHFIEGKTPREIPVQFPKEHHGEHEAFVDGRLAASVDFNFDDIDLLLGEIQETPHDARSIAAELFGRVMGWVWEGNRVSFDRATVKFTILSACLRPDLVGNLNYSDIGKKFGLTKAAICKWAKLFEREFNFHASRSRSEAACEAMGVAQIGHAPTNIGKQSKRRPKPLSSKVLLRRDGDSRKLPASRLR